MPTDSDPSSQRHFIHLDMLRGLCALGVVVGHLRGFLLVDFGSLHTPSLADRMLYFFAGLGHQSVLAFFALSGFLVGGKALTAIVAGTWSWGAYLVARLTRLWTVVVPALIVTLALDRTGTWLTAGNGYDGAYFKILASGPGILNPADNSFTTLLANIAFLQTIASPVFGTNGPLWSLANEFWYYVVFPLAAWTFSRNARMLQRTFASIGATLLSVLLPWPLMVLGLVWVAGAIAFYVASVPRFKVLFAHPAFGAATGAVLTFILVYRPYAHRIEGDLLLGGAWAPMLIALAALPPWGGIYSTVANALSRISYTLYATHFPLLAFLWFTALAPGQSPPNTATLAIGAGMLCLTLLFAAAMWWCFERNTAKVRAAVQWMLALYLKRARSDSERL